MLDWKDKKVLVCGGAGMIGSHLARELVKRGASVTVVDNLSSGSKQNIADIRNGMKFIEADLRDSAICKMVTAKQDVAFQLAAKMGGIGFITSHFADVMHDNALINISMLEAARLNEVPNYFYSSSACVYPNYKQTKAKVAGLKEEEAMPADPNEPYGWEKLFTEQLASSYQKDYGMNIRVARFHNVYGTAMTAFDKLKAKAPCHLIIKAIRHPNPLFEIWGDGKATRSFLYIDDCIEGVLRLEESDFGEPINIGSDRLIAINDLASLIIQISGKTIHPRHDLSKPVGVRGRNSDNTLIRQVLGWETKVSLEDGLERVYRWAEQHFAELENI